MAITRLLAIACIAASLAHGKSQKVFVASFGDRPLLVNLRDAVVSELKRQHGIELANNEKDATVTLTGFGDVYIKGYLSRNLRVRYVTPDSKPIFGGYLSVELDDADQNPIWSYQVTPSETSAADSARSMAGQVVKKLMQFLDKSPRGGQ